MTLISHHSDFVFYCSKTKFQEITKIWDVTCATIGYTHLFYPRSKYLLNKSIIKRCVSTYCDMNMMETNMLSDYCIFSIIWTHHPSVFHPNEYNFHFPLPSKNFFWSLRSQKQNNISFIDELQQEVSLLSIQRECSWTSVSPCLS
jgi:hypothetical protein